MLQGRKATLLCVFGATDDTTAFDSVTDALRSADEPAVMALVGLDDVWHAGTAEELVTCTVLTTASSDTLRWLHDRMPVILHDDAAAAKWLDIENQKTITREMIQPHGRLKFHKVTKRMSKASFQGAECVERLMPPTTISNFFKRIKTAAAVQDGDDDAT
jgi:putative SOS response-associated peptidase YedK